MTVDQPMIEESTPPAPRTLLVRYGNMGLVGEFAYDGQTWPTCSSKVVIRTRRGAELAQVLATACADPGCSKRVTREQIQAYIEKSGGNDFPFSTDGRVIRIATAEDHKEQSRLESEKPRYLAACDELLRELELPMQLVDVELILGGEMTTFFFLSEHRVDFRSLVKRLAAQFHARIQMHQVGARDEARLVADFETCGQHCCCRQYLKILRPISMGSAKMQKATLDPSKISGRCGRLKCCLRYEEATYDELRRKLPKVGSRVRTAEGDGVVVETIILTQLVKVRMENDRIVAVRVEELLDRESPETAAARAPKAAADREPEPQRPAAERESEPRAQQSPPRRPAETRRDRSRQPAKPKREVKKPEVQAEGVAEPAALEPGAQPDPQQSAPARRPTQPSSSAPEQPSGDGVGRPGMGMLGRRHRRRGRGRGSQSNPPCGPTPPSP